MGGRTWVTVSAALMLGAASTPGCSDPSVSHEAVLVFAAASMRPVLDAAAPALLRETGVAVRTSYASSSALARQLEAGGPAALFISADTDWMDYVERRGIIRRDTRVNLAGNRLVLIAPRAEPVHLRIAPGFPLREALGDGRLAIADPSSVPAGKYAAAALRSLGVWPFVEARLAPAENVRAALLLVSRGEAPLGIVYRSDALDDHAVVVVDTFPAATHPPIVYAAALTTSARGDAPARVLSWLRGVSARATFERFGFERLPD